MRDRAADHVPDFVEEHQRPIVETACFFPVLHLKIVEPYEFGDVRLLPITDDQVPQAQQFGRIMNLGGFIGVPCRGSHYGRMAERARSQAVHVLRLLRAGMRSQSAFHREQLRFRLGEDYAFDERLVGWSRREGIPLEASLSREVLEHVLQHRLAALLAHTTTDVHRRATLAVEWIDRALLAPERLLAVLYLFFALEAMLGDKAEGMKSLGLTFRRTVLGHAVSGGFTAPKSIYYLYEKVRSAAVHGSESPEVSQKQVTSFEYDVLCGLDEYLTFTATNSL